MSSLPPISVIIPTHNRPERLEQAILSAARQEYPQVEIIVVDDGSPGEETRLLLNRYPQVCPVFQANRGPGAARNVGVQASRGEFLQFLDDDDCLLPGALAEKAAVLIQIPEIGIVYSDVMLENEQGQTRSLFASLARPLPAGDLYEPLVLRNFIPVHAMLWRRSVFAQAGGFPESYGHEDWSLVLRAAEQTRFAAVDQPLAVYRMHPGSLAQRFGSMFQGKLDLHHQVTGSARFQQIPPDRRASLLAKFAAQQLAYGDALAGQEFLAEARRLAPGSRSVRVVHLLFSGGRVPARAALRLTWLLGQLKRYNLNIH